MKKLLEARGAISIVRTPFCGGASKTPVKEARSLIHQTAKNVRQISEKKSKSTLTKTALIGLLILLSRERQHTKNATNSEGFFRQADRPKR